MTKLAVVDDALSVLAGVGNGIVESPEMKIFYIYPKGTWIF